ncbi:hypothetical protein [Kitasatospora sp. NPDC051164]|uniref:hypothetical protein n=1 Tax=Kitasatospora sp. NPDC051164 TaxID=3364055 RepID=UPI0037A88B2C
MPLRAGSEITELVSGAGDLTAAEVEEGLFGRRTRRRLTTAVGARAHTTQLVPPRFFP